jgi:hypothetical protein
MYRNTKLIGNSYAEANFNKTHSFFSFVRINFKCKAQLLFFLEAKNINRSNVNENRINHAG